MAGRLVSWMVAVLVAYWAARLVADLVARSVDYLAAPLAQKKAADSA
jgi:hypothetical protein